MKKKRQRHIAVWLFACLLIFIQKPAVEAAEKVNFDEAYAEIGEALMQVKKKDWESLRQNAEAIGKFGEQIQSEKDHEKEKTAVMDQINDFVRQAESGEADQKKVQHTLKKLAQSLRTYDEAKHPQDQKKMRLQLKNLLPILAQMDGRVQDRDLKSAKDSYVQLNKAWLANEAMVRSQSVAAYGEIETNLAFIRIGFEKKPADAEQIAASSRKLSQAIQDFLAGKADTGSAKAHDLDEVVSLLGQSIDSIDKQKPDEAIKPLQQVIEIWPMVEGKVRIKDTTLYNDVENKVPAAVGKLDSKQSNLDDVRLSLNDLQARLQLIAAKTSYSFIDAMLILLREGIEAILIVTGLVAFLKRANKGEGQKWVWGGALAGIGASSILAVLLVMFFSNLAGAQNRELLEGIIGIVAVLMMLTIGAWLHKRSNILNWNAYFEKNMGRAIATGSLFSMSMLSFLAIFREGAETVIFYIGMAPAIKISELILGIVLALVLLAIIGVAIIKYSTRIPLRPFFVFAAWLIYVLAFKMIGASIHALQVANVLPLHVLEHMPFIEILGVYPTAETLLPQLVLIALIVLTGYYIRKAAHAAKA